MSALDEKNLITNSMESAHGAKQTDWVAAPGICEDYPELVELIKVTLENQ